MTSILYNHDLKAAFKIVNHMAECLWWNNVKFSSIARLRSSVDWDAFSSVTTGRRLEVWNRVRLVVTNSQCVTKWIFPRMSYSTAVQHRLLCVVLMPLHCLVETFCACQSLSYLKMALIVSKVKSSSDPCWLLLHDHHHLHRMAQ